jgi:hypothetical protein
LRHSNSVVAQFFFALGVRFIGSPQLVLSAGFEAMASPTAEFKIVPHLAQDPNRKLTLRGQKQINLRRKLKVPSIL